MKIKKALPVSNWRSRLAMLGAGFILFGFLAVGFETKTSGNKINDDIAPSALAYTENFDGVVNPNLPAGWTTATTGPQNTPFITQSVAVDTPPWAVFTNDPPTTGSSELVSPPIHIGGVLGGTPPKLIFRNFYDVENTFDGGVLEIKIGNGNFQDIIAAGGTFVAGGYNGTIDPTFNNPLAGRPAWTGSSVSFITTEVNLPPSSYFKSVQLKWRFGSDFIVSDVGWRIDTIQITNILSGENINAISIPASGTASPYPSEIVVSGHDGLITSVQVGLQNFSHTSPDDVDLMLVSPSGRRVVLMSDVGGANPVTNANITFNDTGAALPDNGQIVSGIYRPTDFEPGDAFPAPAPAAGPFGTRLWMLNGEDANGNWRLFLVDDNGNNAGNITGGWNLLIQTSPDVIVIPESGTAQPYPSEKTVSGLPGNVTKAVVTINNFTHSSPDDVDIMLVAPNGRRLVLMSDVGGNTEAGSLNLTFDDAAASSLPDNSLLTSGTYKPTDFEPGDVFPAPAPSGAPNGTTLNAFYGSAPNGIWKLYVVDDSGENLGNIAGNWSLTLTTSTGACVFSISPTIQTFPITGGSGSFGVNMPAGCPWTASANAGFLTIDSGAAGDGNGTVFFSVAPNMEGGRAGTIDVSNGVLVRTFQVQQPSGCPFSLNQTQVGVSSAGGSRSVDVTAGGVCSWQATSPVSWIQITSPQQTGNGAASFTVLPNNGATSRSAVVTVGARTFTVHQAGAAARRFDFDGDGSSDVSVYRPSTGVWYILNSGTPGSYSAIQFGLETDRVAPADFDGDRKFDVTIYRDGTWYIFNSQTNTVRIESWGLTNDTPVPNDYDGDGLADLAVYRPGDGTWYVRRSTDGVYQATAFGLVAGRAVSGDFDGDGRADFAVRRALPGNPMTWAILNSSNGESSSQQFGVDGDIPVVGDFDGDGRDNMAVFRPSNGTWYTSLNPSTNYGAKQWGLTGDTPAAGDYNGDGRADYAIYRQGVWWILHSNDATVHNETWGISTDTVVPAAYNGQ